MSERDAFIRRICENPAEDAVRLVFADWLQENGEGERAEFIRDQIEWRAGSRDLDLLNDNWERWFPDCTRHDEKGFRRLQNYAGALAVPLLNGNTVLFSRGFVSAVWFSRTRSYLHHAEGGYWRQQPVTSVRLIDRTPSNNFGGRTRFKWYWAGDSAGLQAEGYAIPFDVYVRLAPGERHNGWATAEIAAEALSAACVAYGREQAGLPPLPVEVST